MILNTGTLYGKYSHPFGVIYNQKNLNIRKETLKKLPFNLNPKSKVQSP